MCHLLKRGAPQSTIGPQMPTATPTSRMLSGPIAEISERLGFEAWAYLFRGIAQPCFGLLGMLLTSGTDLWGHRPLGKYNDSTTNGRSASSQVQTRRRK
mgnify:CR=1 FL=1